MSFTKQLVLSLAILSVVVFTGCEDAPVNPTSDPNQQRTAVGQWVAPTSQNAPPILYQPQLGGTPSIGYSGCICIRNISRSKLHIVGIVSWTPNPAFIDLQQPGAFNVSLYPDQQWCAYAPGNVWVFGTQVYWRIQDWSLE